MNTYEIAYRDNRERDGVAWVSAASVVDAVGVLMVQASAEGIHRVVTKLTKSESEG